MEGNPWQARQAAQRERREPSTQARMAFVLIEASKGGVHFVPLYLLPQDKGFAECKLGSSLLGDPPGTGRGASLGCVPWRKDAVVLLLLPGTTWKVTGSGQDSSVNTGLLPK